MKQRLIEEVMVKRAIRHAIQRGLVGLGLVGSLLIPSIALAMQERVKIGQAAGAFSMDKTEVTVAQFRAYADREGVVTAAESEGGGFEYRLGWQRRAGWTYRTPFGAAAADDEPAVHVSWHEARAYCQAAGGDLPNREQWEKAAYQETRINPPSPFETGEIYDYPTGIAPDEANTVGDEDGWERHAPVGQFAPGVNGLFDMGANAWEWLLDANADERLTAGGSWWYGPSKMKASGMQYKAADFYAVYVGFRCVYP